MSKETFWVTNISNMNVTLSDLNLTIKANSSVNLLDNKHYYYNKKQLIDSAASGSIYKKSDKIFIRKVSPTFEKINQLQLSSNSLPSRDRSIFVIKHENYEELELSDDEFAEQNSDLVDESLPITRKI